MRKWRPVPGPLDTSRMKSPNLRMRAEQTFFNHFMEEEPPLQKKQTPSFVQHPSPAQLG